MPDNAIFVHAQSIAERVRQFVRLVDDYSARFNKEAIVSEGDGSEALNQFYKTTQSSIDEVVGLDSSIRREFEALSSEAKAKASYLILRELCQYVAKSSEFSTLMQLLRPSANSGEAENKIVPLEPKSRPEDYTAIY